MPTLSHLQAALKRTDRELAHLASAPRTKSIRRLGHFHLCLRHEIVLRTVLGASHDLQACSLRVSHLIPCSTHPLTSTDSSSACPTPNTCDLYFALDKTSSFKLVPSDNQPIQSISKLYSSTDSPMGFQYQLEDQEGGIHMTSASASSLALWGASSMILCPRPLPVLSFQSSATFHPSQR